MTRHDSVWLDDPARRSGPWAPPISGAHRADVVVVGAGITGLTTALLAAREGHRVVVLEGRRVGAGTSGHTTGKVTSQHGLLYARLTDWAGEDRARQYADANEAGVQLVARLVDELSIDCDLTRADAFAYVRTPGHVHEVEREVEAAARLGLPASRVDDCGLPFPVDAGIRFGDQYHLHAGRYLDGLAKAVVDAGGAIHEQSRVTGVAEAHGRVVVETSSGSVEAAHAVVATLLPPGILGGYFARTRPQLSYGLALRLGADAPLGMTISADHPVWSTRPWPGGGPNGLIVVGNGHEVGAPVDTEDHYAGLEAWARRTFDVAEVTHRWCAHDYVTPDRVPYVGRLPLYDRVQVATGFGKWGLSNGTAAALMLTDGVAGRVSPWHDVFDAGRIDGLRAVPDLVLGNAKVGAELVVGELRRDAPRCTHLGCRLRWNAAEETWDCHCHGSRFHADGSVLAGPAVQPLSDPVGGPVSGHSTG